MVMRTILGAGKPTSKYVMEVALDIILLRLRRKQLTYNYWLQASQDKNHPVYQAFREPKYMGRNHHNHNTKTNRIDGSRRNENHRGTIKDATGNPNIQT